MPKEKKYTTLEDYYAENRRRAKAWYDANPERAKEIRQKYNAKLRIENPELARQRDRESRARWVANNREKVNEENRAYYQANKKQIAEKRKERYALSKLDKPIEAGE